MVENKPNITFVIGDDKRLCEVIGRAELEPLLQSSLKAGLVGAAVIDEDDLAICSAGGNHLMSDGRVVRHPLLVEGEPRGYLVVEGGVAEDTLTVAVARILKDAIQLTLNNNLKRMLTTEVHTSVVQESYDQLVESNRHLCESEARYRELALSLEQKVVARTAELQKAYAHMLQQEKLASVGQLAAGMAHEINNPNGFVLSNLNTFRRYVARLKEMLELFRFITAQQTPAPGLVAQAEKRWQELKISFVLEDAEMLLEQSIDGATRIKKIVENLKGFSHLDGSSLMCVDLNTELERTLSVVLPQLASDTRIIKDFSVLPLFNCNPALFCQAFLCIIQNSLLSREAGLELCIRTAVESGKIVIAFMDNGCGIASENIQRIFDPFFTTRDVGHGTGMGLTVVRDIVSSCDGRVEVESTLGSGTTVRLILPLSMEERPVADVQIR